MDTNMNPASAVFDTQIQKWVEVDNKIKKMNAELKSSREMKNELETSIMTTVNNRKLLNTSLSLPDGRLRFVETKTTNPISLTFVEQCLNELIPNKSQVQHILKYMKEKREIKINPEIKKFNLKLEAPQIKKTISRKRFLFNCLLLKQAAIYQNAYLRYEA